MTRLEDILNALALVRARRPLVHNITNYVAMNNTANALLALGASPAMVHAREEVADFVRISKALVINIGTLSTAWVEAMNLAISAAEAASIPWVLDPVGAGATIFRTKTASALLARRPTVLRANATEVLALAGRSGAQSGGVDSVHTASDAAEVARSLARELGIVVAVTGAVDIVTDGADADHIHNGHPSMTQVTALGCSASALTGAFLGVGVSPRIAATSALCVLGLSGERAARRSPGPGSLAVHLLDELAGLDETALRREGRLS